MNQLFAKTLSEAALGISSSLLEYADTADLDGTIGKLSAHVTEAGERMAKGSSLLTAYSSVLGSAQSLIGNSSSLLTQVGASADEVSASVDSAKQSAGTVTSAMDDSVSALSTALDQSAASTGAVSDSVDAAFDSAAALSGDSAAQLRAAGGNVDAQVQDYRTLVSQLEQLKGSLPEGNHSLVDTLIARLNASIALQEQLRDSLYSAADSVEAGSADTQAKREEVKSLLRRRRKPWRCEV
ncbi:MAG: hypothetical protein ACLTQI_04455 [Slackia sp.]